MTEVRVRFPPSPTGYLHIGGARTALLNWLWARKNNGKLILRIEDTDAERSTQESIEGIIDGMNWLGLDWDEGPYFQTEFSDEHKKAADQLVASGHAYKCFCTKEELDQKREAAMAARKDVRYDGTCRNLTPEQVAEKEARGIPYVIRFKVEQREGKVAYEDKILGTIERAYDDIEDFVIVRSNGKPLYLLCNVVDDIRDRITHIIRGQDHMSNTTRQVLLYQALDAPIPVFAHMPLTLDLQKRKISKRSHGEIVAVQFYREKGFIPWALCNFLALLGWNPGTDQEIFSREELIETFTLERIGKVNSVFNYQKGNAKFFTGCHNLFICGSLVYIAFIKNLFSVFFILGLGNGHQSRTQEPPLVKIAFLMLGNNGIGLVISSFLMHHCLMKIGIKFLPLASQTGNPHFLKNGRKLLENHVDPVNDRLGIIHSFAML